jgi:hypothetical protein
MTYTCTRGRLIILGSRTLRAVRRRARLRADAGVADAAALAAALLARALHTPSGAAHGGAWAGEA